MSPGSQGAGHAHTGRGLGKKGDIPGGWSVMEESQRSQAQLGWRGWGSREQEARQGNQPWAQYHTACDKKPRDAHQSSKPQLTFPRFTLATVGVQRGMDLRKNKGNKEPC